MDVGEVFKCIIWCPVHTVTSHHPSCRSRCCAACRMIAERLVSTSSFQVLVTSRQLPPTPCLRKIGEFPCPYSWTLAGVAHVYTRHDLLAAPISCLSEFLSADGICWLPHDRLLHVPIVAEENVPLRQGDDN
jgi:hypothetical protein